MIKIRLMRIGAKKRPFYRVVVVNEQAKRTGGYIELLGTYNPLSTPKDIKLKQDRIDYWIKQGAKPSTGYLRIIGKAPQRLPRKAKKEKKEATTNPAVAAESAPTPEESSSKIDTATSEQPIETPKEEVPSEAEPLEKAEPEEKAADTNKESQTEEESAQQPKEETPTS